MVEIKRTKGVARTMEKMTEAARTRTMGETMVMTMESGEVKKDQGVMMIGGKIAVVMRERKRKREIAGIMRHGRSREEEIVIALTVMNATIPTVIGGIVLRDVIGTILTMMMMMIKDGLRFHIGEVADVTINFIYNE